MLKEVRFSYQHPHCWLQEATERYPTLTLVISAVYQVDDIIHIDLFVHAPSAAIIKQLLSEWSQDKRIKKVTQLFEGPRGTRFHVSYSARHSIYPHIIHHTPVSLGSINMANGTEHYSIVGESADVQNLLAVLRKEGSATVTSIRALDEVTAPTDPDAPSTLFSTLTDKQVEALIMAHMEGYYNWPRVLSAADLAARVGLSSAAFLDHLRRAEAKALDVVIKDLKAQDPARFDAIRARLSAARRLQTPKSGPR